MRFFVPSLCEILMPIPFFPMFAGGLVDVVSIATVVACVHRLCEPVFGIKRFTESYSPIKGCLVPFVPPASFFIFLFNLSFYPFVVFSW